MKKMVKAVVRRMAEKKMSSLYDLDQVLYGSAAAAAAAFDANNVVAVTRNLSVGIVQGTEAGNRIGNKVTVTKLTFKGTIVPTTYDVTTNPAPCPMQIRMVAFYDKLFQTGAGAAPTPQTDQNLLDLGDNDVGLQNDLVDQWGDFNNERYVILKEQKFKLGNAIFTPTNGGDPASGNFANNDFKYNCNFNWDLTKHIPKIMQWDNDGFAHTSRGLWIMFIISKANGGQYASTHIPAAVQYSQTLSFIDT